MKKKELKQVEDKILQFFKTEEKIKFLQNVIISLEDKKMDLEQKNKTLNINFDIDIKAMSINGMPSATTNNSYFENNIMKQIQNNENIINNLIEDIDNKKSEVERLEIANTTMKNIISFLPLDYINLLELKYIKKYSEIAITNSLNISTSQYHRNRHKIFENIYNLLLINGEIGV